MQNAPDICRLFTQVIMYWIDLENELARLFEIATASVTPTIWTESSFSAELHMNDHARIVYDELETLHMREKALKATLSNIISTTLFDEFNDLMSRIRKVSRVRNIIAHSTWHFNGDDRTVLLRGLNNKSYQEWRIADFQDSINRTISLTSDLRAFVSKVLRRNLPASIQ